MASQAKLSRIAINNILLATDFSPEAQNALRYAISLVSAISPRSSSRMSFLRKVSA